MKWEFKIMETSGPEGCEEMLNGEGDAGWELVTVIEEEALFFHYFKRPAQE